MHYGLTNWVPKNVMKMWISSFTRVLEITQCGIQNVRIITSRNFIIIWTADIGVYVGLGKFLREVDSDSHWHFHLPPGVSCKLLSLSWMMSSSIPRYLLESWVETIAILSGVLSHAIEIYPWCALLSSFIEFLTTDYQERQRRFRQGFWHLKSTNGGIKSLRLLLIRTDSKLLLRNKISINYLFQLHRQCAAWIVWRAPFLFTIHQTNFSPLSVFSVLSFREPQFNSN